MVETFKKAKDQLLIWALGSVFAGVIMVLSVQYSDARTIKAELASLEKKYVMLDTYNRDTAGRQAALNRIENKLNCLNTDITKLLMKLMKE